jgi:hypothetical protein
MSISQVLVPTPDKHPPHEWLAPFQEMQYMIVSTYTTLTRGTDRWIELLMW